jgi:hypothetical protein
MDRRKLAGVTWSRLDANSARSRGIYVVKSTQLDTQDADEHAELLHAERGALGGPL